MATTDSIYLGNPNLKKANTPMEFTPVQIQEFVKCKGDPVYFCKNYIKIVSLDEGLVPFDMYDFQVDQFWYSIHKQDALHKWMRDALKTVADSL